MTGGVSRVSKFLGDHGVMLVFVPGMVAVHWAWFRLQDNELFVSRENRDSHPLYKQKQEIIGFFKRKFGIGNDDKGGE